MTVPTAKKTLKKLARGPVSVFLMAEYDSVQDAQKTGARSDENRVGGDHVLRG
jgi:hypothetical protein